MSDENMSIARMEAKSFFRDRKLLGKDINKLERLCYIKGRTAEPCKEQVEAAAKVLADWSDPCIDCFDDRCRHIANLMLEAARKAVM